MKVETFILVPNIEVKVPLTPKDFEKKFINIEDKIGIRKLNALLKIAKMSIITVLLEFFIMI